MKRLLVFAAMTSFVLVTQACTSTSGAGGGSGGRAGGGTGGGTGPGTGGGSGGASPGTGGMVSGTGGPMIGTGGQSPGTGGTMAGPGGNGSGGVNAGGNGDGTEGGTGGRGGGGTVPPGSGGAVACAAPSTVTTGTAATVIANLGGTLLATVGPDLIGVHTAVWDGLLTTTPNTVTLLKAAGVTSWRYPGGSYADLYHWESNTGSNTPAFGFGGPGPVSIIPSANFGRFVSTFEAAGANAFITVNYGMNSAATGPGSPKEAAAWVAYANGSASDNTVIGLDNSVPPVDFKTVGYWAGLRSSPPLAVDTVPPTNFLRINHPTPIGIKYWEIGNEPYGNGYYQGSATTAGWEADLHAPYNGTNGTARFHNSSLAPQVYGAGVTAFAAAMKAVDPAIMIGGTVNWPDTSYANPATTPMTFNAAALSQACTGMDFAVAHWYPGNTIVSLLTAARTLLPPLFVGLRGLLTTNCGARGATMPIAITEFGPNVNDSNNQIFAALVATVMAGTPSLQTQIVGLFAADSYATFMEQGAVAAHWTQLHDVNFIGQLSRDTGWGYHGAVLAHQLASSGDGMLPQPVSSNTNLLTHASRHTDGSVSMMLINTSATAAANVTLNVTGGALGCAGTRYAYTPAAGTADRDGAITSASIFSATDGTNVHVLVPAYSVVVLAFPPR
jgi:hypothetical protein